MECLNNFLKLGQKKIGPPFFFADFFDDVIDLDFEILVYYGKSVGRQKRL